MMYEVGDKVVVKQTNDDAIVLEIINDQMVMLEVRGVKFPAYSDQIEYPYFKMFTQKKPLEKKKIYIDNIPKEKQIVKKDALGIGVHIQFLPVFDKDVFDDDVVEKLKVYLVNENDEAYEFDYNLYFSGEPNLDLKNKVGEFSIFYLHDINFEDTSDNPKFSFVFSLANDNKKKAPYFESEFKITGKKLFKRIEEMQLNNESYFKYELFKHYPEKEIAESKLELNKLSGAGFRIYDVSNAKEYIAPARSVLDLHIEKITDDYKTLTNFEILNIQLNEFEKYFDLAILHKLKIFIVVHGIGEGTLKNEIHDFLKLRKEVSSFVNQYHSMYGYGSTEIFFK